MMAAALQSVQLFTTRLHKSSQPLCKNKQSCIRCKVVGEEATRPSFGSEEGNEISPLQKIGNFANGVKERVISRVAELSFKPRDDPPNFQFLGNYAPVPEIERKTEVQVVAGAVPKDFPAGVYVRNGPNPQFGGKDVTGPLGVVEYHVFESDGMLHATYFQEGGRVTYLNRYVGTETYRLEKERGKPVWLNSFDGDSKAISFAYLLNSLRFGKANKVTANTHVFSHAGKYYAIAEGDHPHEFRLSDLNTIGVWDGCGGHWNRPFTAHPLHDPETGELIFFGFNPVKPYAEIGIWSADGSKVVHKIDMQLDRCVFCHEIAITRRYTLFFDFPLVLSMERLMNGGRIMEFEESEPARVGILPRYGDANSTKWFIVQTGFSWHKINSFEDGDDVVVFGMRARRPIIPYPTDMDKKQFWKRAMQPVAAEFAENPWIDGALSTQVYEWRFNMVTGEVVERDLSKYAFSGEYPTINPAYAGIKNKYGYITLSDIPASLDAGMAMMRGWVKVTLPQSVHQEMEAEIHDLGSGWGASEASFVARAGAIAEDDGWLLAYVHHEETNISYLYILDAQNFSGAPVAKIQLPRRVPYGFHGKFFPSKR